MELSSKELDIKIKILHVKLEQEDYVDLKI